MATPIDELFFEISVRQQALEKQLKGVQGQLRRTDRTTRDFDASARRASRSATSMGTAFRRLAVAAGGLLVLREAVRAITGFDRSMREIATIAGGGAEQVARLREEILEMVREIPQTPGELGAGAYQILSAGISDTADVLSVLEASSRAAVAGLTDTETSVDAVTTVLNAFGKQAGEAERVTDVLFKTVELGKLRFEDISQNIGAAATSAALAGISFEELSAAAAVMTQRGIDAAESFTSLNRLALTLVQQTDQQRAAFDRLGISFDTATVAEKGFAGLLEELNKLTEGQVDQLSELFPNIRAARSAFILAGSATEDYRKTLDQLHDSQGAARVAFDEMNESIENQAQLLKNRLNARLQELSVKIMPAVLFVFEGWNQLLDLVSGKFSAIAEHRRDIEGIADAAERLGTERATLKVIIGPELVAAAKDVQRLRDEIEELEQQEPVSVAGLLGAGLGPTVTSGRAQLDDQLEEAEERLKALQQAAARLSRRVQRDTDTADKPDPGESPAERAKRLKAADEAAKQQAKLREELAKRVREITLSAAEQEIAAVEDLRKAYVEAFGEISAEAEEQFAIVQEAAEAALRRERAEQLADEFTRAIEEGFASIELRAIGIADPEARTAFVLEEQQDLLAGLLTQAQERLGASEATTEEEEKLRDVIKEIVKLLGQAKGEQKDLGDEAKKEAERRFRDLQQTVSLVREAADGAVDLANAFGLVNDETAELLENLTQIGTSAATLVAAIGSGNIAGIVSGGIGLLGGIAQMLGGGESPAEEARRRLVAENTQALEELRAAVNDLRGTLDISGRDFAALLQALTVSPILIGQDLGQEAFIERLADFGLTLGDAERIAKEFGITLLDSEGRVIPEAVGQLIEALQLFEGELVGFPGTIAGIRARLEAEFAILDIDDPMDQFRRFIEELVGLDEAAELREALAALREELENTTDPIRRINLQAAIAALEAQLESAAQGIPAFGELFALDTSTAEGRQRAEQIIEQLFRDLAAGVITPEQLGVATFEEAVEVLRVLEALLDDIEANTAGEGELQDVRRAVQITEIQADALLAFQSTQTALQRQMADRLAGILDVLREFGSDAIAPPPSVMLVPPNPIGPPGTVDAAGGSGFTVQFLGDMHISIPGGDPQSVERAADQFVDEIREKLGRALRQRERLLGIRDIR